MKNKNRPFYYEEKKTPFYKKLLIVLFTAAVLIFAGFQIPFTRQVIAEPVYAAGSLVYNALKDFISMTRMYHEPESKPMTYEPLELPDQQVLFAEDLESLSAITQEDPLAELRQTPTPSEFTRVAQWEYQDPNLNYAVSSGGSSAEKTAEIRLIPPVFERADLFNDGPAILSAALRYFGKVENQYNISNTVHPDPLSPFTGLDALLGYTENRYPDMSGLIRINGTKETLSALLDKDIPVILPIQFRTAYSFWPKDDHFSARYLLILGYSSSSDQFSCQDTARGNTLTIQADELMSAWYPFLRTYMIIYPAEKDSDIRDALMENYFEELNLQNAEAKFRTDSENLPQNAFAQYNYGSVLHRTGDNGGAWERFLMADDLHLPQRYLYYQADILQTALELGYADDIDRLVDPVLRRNSHSEILTMYRGWAMILRGDAKKGAEQFEKAKKINPNSEMVLYGLKYKETMLQL